MGERLTFQEMVWRLAQFWAGQGCLLWQPHNVQVGAGTMNPATFLRVLGPEPWRVGYVEPSIRPDDSRYGQNPNRWQQHFQFQVILKPDPGNPQELYLDSLEALGLDLKVHDVRFVEDNWETPALAAWGLGWEVWLDGQEVTQFTYFQQAGGIPLNPVSVEITYGLERLLMPLQGVGSFPELEWREGISYGELLLPPEEQHSRYNLDAADIELVKGQFAIYEQEARNCLDRELIFPAYDYLLKCSHAFNLLDARGAVGVAERAGYFARMRELARRVAEGYLAERERLGYPLLAAWPAPSPPVQVLEEVHSEQVGEGRHDFLLEIGTEELPAGDLTLALKQLQEMAPKALAEARLDHGLLKVMGTPRRLVLYVQELAPRQRDRELVRRGPPAGAAYDNAGHPTRAAQGFARSVGIPVEELRIEEFQGRRYAVAQLVEIGRPARQVLPELLPGLISGLDFPLSMRWNETDVSFSRPIRWLVALWGEEVIPFQYAGVHAGRASRGSRLHRSPGVSLHRAEEYFQAIERAGIEVDPARRRALITEEIAQLAEGMGGTPEYTPGFLEEVANLVEEPQAVLGSFPQEYLSLPPEVLTTVMQKHQRYFPVLIDGKPLPHFIAIANGKREDTSTIRRGNEDVLNARLADARFFFQADTSRPLEAFIPKLATLTFQEKLGSMLDKVERIKVLIPKLFDTNVSKIQQAMPSWGLDIAFRAAELCKADLATQMVVEFTSLQGVMGREYALRSGEDPRVARAIYRHYLPRGAHDDIPIEDRNRRPPDMPAVILALADRLDTLAGLFAVGLKPTGSADPYGLRRQALGLVRILTEKHGIRFSLREGIRRAAEGLPMEMTEEAQKELWEFTVQRLRGRMQEFLSYDVVEAILGEQADNPYRALFSGEVFNWWIGPNLVKFQELLPAYARTARIIPYARSRGLAPETDPFPLDPEALVEPASRKLYEAYLSVGKEVKRAKGMAEFLQAMLPLVEPINIFFDQVLVVAQEEALLYQPEEVARRHNRLALLQRIAGLASGWLDFSKLEGF